GREAQLGLVRQAAIEVVPEARGVLGGRELPQGDTHGVALARRAFRRVVIDGIVAVAARGRRCHDALPPASSEPLVLAAPLDPFGDPPAALRLATLVSAVSADVASSSSASG